MFNRKTLGSLSCLSSSPPGKPGTALPCPDCGAALDIRRTCHEAYMHCPACKKSFELSPFISRMDDAMENFLEHLYVDRV